MTFEENKGRLTTDEAREIGRKGGLASVAARREKKMLASLVEMYAGLPAPENLRKTMATLGITENDRTNAMASVVGLFQKAMRGDVQAFNAIRDIMGEKPVDETKLTGTLDTNIEIGFVESGVEPKTSENEIEI